MKRALLLLFAVALAAASYGCYSPPQEPAETIVDLSLSSRELDPERVEVVQGDRVVLRVESDEPGDFHVTGYEIIRKLDPDGATAISFDADLAGRFNLELHPASDHDSGSDGSAHGHGTRSVPAEDAPTLSLEVSKDAIEGYNVEFRTSKINFTPQSPGISHVDGQGHAHVYVDGVKVGRFYEKKAYLGRLDPGTREIRATLSDNLHGEYAVNGRAIEAAVTLDVPESGEVPEPQEGAIVDSDPAMSLSVSVTEDPSAGWNLVLNAENFEYAPELAGVRHVPGQGHANLWADGRFLTRLYGPSHHLESLGGGAHEIRVELVDNLRRNYVASGRPVEFSFSLEGSEEEHRSEEEHSDEGGQHEGATEDVILGSLTVTPR